MAQRSFEELIRILRERGVTQQTLDDIAELSRQATENTFSSETASPTDIQSYFNRYNSSLEQYRSELGEFMDIDEQLIESYEEEMSILRDVIDSELESTQVNQDRLKNAQDRYKELVKLRKEKQSSLEGMKKGEAAAEQLLQATFGLSTEWSMLNSKEGMKGFAKGFGKSLKDMLNPINILISIAQKVVERALTYDKAAAEVFKRTGIDRAEIDLVKMSTELKGMTADIQNSVAGAVGDLQEGFRSIGELEKEQLESAVKTVTILDAVGAQNRDTVESFGILTKTLGKTPEQAVEFLNNTRAIATELSRPPGQIISDFAKASPILSRFGQASVKIFKDLSLQSVLLNMDVQKLVGLTEGMDTFEGAAKAAQAFNVAVGGPFLSAQALLAADPQEKLQLIADAYQQAGNQPLSARVKRGLAKSLNVTPDELERILKNNVAGMKTKRERMDEVQTTMQQNIKDIGDNQSAMNKLVGKMQEIIDNLVEATGFDKGLGRGADLLVGVAYTMTEDHDLQRSHAAKMKIAKEGGLVAVTGDRAFTKKEIADARKHGSTDELLMEHLHTTTATGQSPMEMSDAEFNDYLKKQKVITPEGKVLTAEDAITMQSEAAKIGLGTAIGAGAAILAGVLVNIAGVGADATLVGAPLGVSAHVVGAGLIAGGLGTFYGTGLADEHGIGRGLSEGSVGYQIQPTEDAMVTPQSLGKNYVHPVFNKDDMFYAAKEGGAIAKALDEVLHAVDKLIEEKQDVNLDINERKLAQAVDSAFVTLNSRRV